MDEWKEKYEALEREHRQQKIESELLAKAVGLGLKQSAMQDLKYRARDWDLDENGDVVLKRDGQVVTDHRGLPVTADAWLKEQRQSGSDWFEPAGGAGADNRSPDWAAHATVLPHQIRASDATDVQKFRKVFAESQKLGREMEIIEG